MKRVILFTTVFIYIVLFPSACTTKPPLPSPQPTPYPYDIPIPEWVKTPADIQTWLRTEKATYVSDTLITGYKNYYFTPAEFMMTTIPDTNSEGKIISKTPFQGDCDDFAIFTAYVMSTLGYQSYYMVIADTESAHAISYAIGPDNIYHIYDLWFYKKGYSSVNEYVKKVYPTYQVISYHMIQDFLNVLFAQGHVQKYEVNYRQLKPTASCAQISTDKGEG